MLLRKPNVLMYFTRTYLRCSGSWEAAPRCKEKGKETCSTSSQAGHQKERQERKEGGLWLGYAPFWGSVSRRISRVLQGKQEDDDDLDAILADLELKEKSAPAKGKKKGGKRDDHESTPVTGESKEQTPAPVESQEQTPAVVEAAGPAPGLSDLSALFGWLVIYCSGTSSSALFGGWPRELN